MSVESTAAHTGWPALDHGIEKWQKNPSLMLYKLQSASYKFSWLLIPLSLPFLWVLFFWKRQYKLYDHTIFITYSIAFMSLCLHRGDDRRRDRARRRLAGVRGAAGARSSTSPAS